MNVDPTGKSLISLLIISTAVGAYVGHGASTSVETCDSLGITGWKRFGYAISGIFIGNYLVVKNNWDTIASTIAMSSENDRNFKFQENQYYNFYTAGLYAKYLKKTFYENESSRTTVGLYIELQLHYMAYLVGNSHGTDGAYMGVADWEIDSSAYLSEFIAELFFGGLAMID